MATEPEMSLHTMYMYMYVYNSIFVIANHTGGFINSVKSTRIH